MREYVTVLTHSESSVTGSCFCLKKRKVKPASESRTEGQEENAYFVEPLRVGRRSANTHAKGAPLHGSVMCAKKLFTPP